MIFVTGDTHGIADIEKLRRFSEETSNLTKADYMIVLGDFGGVWSEATLDSYRALYEAFPFTTLFIDGNHENFDLLESFPVEMWRGGKVHVISSDLIHLMRGQIYELGGKTFFTFGGATSLDRYRRVEGVSWWRRELPTYEELDEGIAALRERGGKVDFILTHSCDERALWYPPLRSGGQLFSTYPENRMLSWLEDNAEYGHWYFGHYHLDGDLTERKTVLYREIRRIL